MIVDDYGAIPQCKEAVTDFRARHDIIDPMETVDWTVSTGSAPERYRRALGRRWSLTLETRSAGSKGLVTQSSAPAV